MIVDLIPHNPPRRDLNASYPLRTRFWFTSVAGHILWVAIMVRIPLSTPSSQRPIYDQFIRPLESKVLVYRPPKKIAPAVPEKQVGNTPDPRGQIFALRTVIATAPKALSQNQIIWKPGDAPELTVDVPAPTLVGRVAAMPPPPPKLAPKQFTPPPVTKSDPKLQSTEVTAALANAPAVTVTPNTSVASNPLLTPPPKVAPKQFVPPPASLSQPKLAINTEVNETLASAAPLTVAQSGVTVSQTNLPPPPKVAPKQFQAPPSASKAPQQAAKTEVNTSLAAVPQVNGAVNGQTVPSATVSRLPGPPKDLPPAPTPTRGNDQVNIAVASVNPVPNAQVPASARSGQFSVAPVSGEPSSGAAPQGALTVPNLAVREPAAPAKSPALKSNTFIYAEKVRAATSATFTVPLRAVNRSVPKAIEAYFPGRALYAVVIPIENLPAYGTDWILWFAESTPQAGPPPSVRAPIPIRKLEPIEKGRDPNNTRLQIAATLGADGRLNNIKVLSAASSTVQALAIEDLSSWEWKAATRNNIPISIDAVFEIPFRLAIRP